MATNPSPNMNLPIATVSVEPGPQWAQDINNSLTIIDGHNHAPGYGVPINPSGLNINSDLPIGNNNLTSIKSVRLQPQSAPLSGPADLGALYESGVDLFYNDGSGNQIRITQGGGLAGTPGSIANLTSPASATYVSSTQTFVWESDANTPANLDAGFVILRNNIANSFGLTLLPPNAMGSNFSIVLPTLPAQTNIMTLDASGNIGATLNVDNSTLTISGNQIKVANAGITAAQIAPGAITYPALGPLNSVLGLSSGGYASNSGTYDPVPNQSVTITTTGRPVMITWVSDTQVASFNTASYFGGQATNMQLYRDSTLIAFSRIGSNAAIQIPPGSFQQIDFPPAGTYTYGILAASIGGNFEANYVMMLVYEL